MVQERNDKKFNQQPQRNQQMPERQKEEYSGQSKKTQRPEIDLPLKGGRSESDLSSTKQPRKDERDSFEKPVRK